MEGIRIKKMSRVNINQNIDHHFFTNYCQNVSGMRTKINKINELLAKSSFHTISLQETWFNGFNDEIGDIEHIELTKNTNYTLFRQDRWETGHHKKGGGGVATLVKSDIKVRRHNFQEIKTLQYICLELTKKMKSEQKNSLKYHFVNRK